MEPFDEPVRNAMRDIEVLADGVDHPEAVTWGAGYLWCGTERGALVRIDPKTGAMDTIASPGGLFLGLALDGDSNCYVCDAGQGRIVRIGMDGTWDVVTEAVAGRRLQVPGDPVFGPDGTLWVTESGSRWEADDGFLFRIGVDGEPELVTELPNRFPNGLALSHDGSTLYVVESRLPGVVRFDLDTQGSMQKEVVITLPRTVPDGLALDEDGRLYISCWRPDRIYRIELDGSLRIYLDDFSAEYLNSPTNVCFGGEELKTLYIAGLCGRTISQVRSEVAGMPLNYPHLSW